MPALGPPGAVGTLAVGLCTCGCGVFPHCVQGGGGQCPIGTVGGSAQWEGLAPHVCTEVGASCWGLGLCLALPQPQGSGLVARAYPKLRQEQRGKGTGRGSGVWCLQCKLIPVGPKRRCLQRVLHSCARTISSVTRAVGPLDPRCLCVSALLVSGWRDTKAEHSCSSLKG